jgi:uncharacterized delta-60 repeat protein
VRRAAGTAGAVLLVLAVTAAPVFAADGAIDRSFGKKGHVVTSFTPGSSVNEATVLLVDRRRRITSVGAALDGPELLGFARYLAGGGLDRSFGLTGVIYPGNIPAVADPVAAAFDSKHRLLVVGRENVGGDSDTFLARYIRNGLPDTSFGNDSPNPVADGFSVVGYGGEDRPAGLAFAGNQIIVAGTHGDDMAGGTNDLYLSAFNLDGSLDTSYGIGGAVSVSLGTDDFATGMALVRNRKILISGTSDGRIFVARFTLAGTLDPSFGHAGVFKTSRVGVASHRVGGAMAVDPSGRILVVNSTTRGTKLFASVVRLHFNGSIDRSFGSNGIRMVPVRNDGATHLSRAAIALSDDGRIAVTYGGDSIHGQVVRLKSNGSIDRTFGKRGFATPKPEFNIEALAIQPDRRILIGGEYAPNGSRNDQILVRLLGDTHPPGTRIVSGPSGTVAPGTRLSFRFRALKDVHTHFQCKFLGVTGVARHGLNIPFKSCRAHSTFGRTDRRSRYLLKVRAVDPAGNADPTPAVRRIRVR